MKLLIQKRIKRINFYQGLIIDSGLDNRFFSIGLYSSADTIKTSVNIEFGFKLFKYNNFEMKSYTSIVGSKIYDDNTDMYQLGFMQKFTFGNKDIYTGEISIARYAFTFVSFGFISFEPDKTENLYLQDLFIGK